MTYATSPPDAATQAELLSELKILAQETGEAITPSCGDCTLCAGGTGISSAAFTDAELLAFLAASDWNLRKAAYDVLLRKAESSDIRFPSGLTLPDEAQYYLRLARQARPNRSCTVQRADGV